jgi:hypothetical protein
MCFIDNQRRIFMKQQVIEDINIMPQLDRACGLVMHKDKIVGFISWKYGAIRGSENLAPTPTSSNKSGIGYRRMLFSPKNPCFRKKQGSERNLSF